MQRVSVFIDNSNVFKNIYSIKNDTKDFSWVSLYDPLKLGQVLAGSRKLEKVFFIAYRRHLGYYKEIKKIRIDMPPQ